MELDQGFSFMWKFWNMTHISVHPPIIFLECTLCDLPSDLKGMLWNVLKVIKS